MNGYTYKRINTIEALNETLDKSEVKPNWIIYPKLESLRMYAPNAFEHFAPVVLVYQDNQLVGGANRENGNIVVYGLQGGFRITDSFGSDDITTINRIIDKES